MFTLVSLSENDKRLIILILLLFILLFVICGYIGKLVKKIMKSQGKKMDTLVHDVVITGVIKEKRKLFLFGIKKSHRRLIKDAWIPFLIMLVATTIYVIYGSISKNWVVFGDGSVGISTLFFIPDWENASYTTVFGITVLQDWPPALSAPHFDVNSIVAYIFFFSMLVGGVWFLVCTQAFIARTHRLIKLCNNVFEKSLENYGGMADDSAPKENTTTPTN